MATLLKATVTTPKGARFVATVANLTTTGLFLRTGEDLRFGDKLTLSMLGFQIPAEVLFVSSEPPGVVVSIAASAEARPLLETRARTVEVLAPKPPDRPWEEDTAAEPLPELPNPIADLVTEAVAGAQTDGGTVHPWEVPPAPAPVSAPLEILDPVDLAEVPAEASPPPEPEKKTQPEMEGLDPALLASASLDDATPLPEIPVLAADFPSAPLPPIPVLEEDLPAQKSAPPRASSGAPIPVVDPTLPDLEGDTVKFTSQENFRAQFASNLMHGGLVVRARPLQIGTQRLLALAVPGFEPYTVSARVVFAEPGRLGFMLDSFNLHKQRLQQLADSPAPVASTTAR